MFREEPVLYKKVSLVDKYSSHGTNASVSFMKQMFIRLLPTRTASSVPGTQDLFNKWDARSHCDGEEKLEWLLSLPTLSTNSPSCQPLQDVGT